MAPACTGGQGLSVPIVTVLSVVSMPAGILQRHAKTALSEHVTEGYLSLPLL